MVASVAFTVVDCWFFQWLSFFNHFLAVWFGMLFLGHFLEFSFNFGMQLYRIPIEMLLKFCSHCSCFCFENEFFVLGLFKNFVTQQSTIFTTFWASNGLPFAPDATVCLSSTINRFIKTIRLVWCLFLTSFLLHNDTIFFTKTALLHHLISQWKSNFRE